MTETRGVLCCGNLVFDIVVYPADTIGWNQTMWVDSIVEGIGGNGASTSCVLAKMGVPVRLVSMVGDDERGRKLVQVLQNCGVDTQGISHLAGVPTAATCILVQQGGARSFYHRPGASRELDAASVNFEPGSCTHFHLANPFSMEKLRTQCGDLMHRAKESGLTTSLDTGWDALGRWIDDLGSALAYTDLLFVNEAEAEMLGGERKLRASGVRDLIVKTGAEGCIVNGERIPGFAVEALDSTGAGDCFAGAFIAGLQRGLSLQECARLANAAGAMNVEHLGATTGSRGYEETLLWMESRRTP